MSETFKICPICDSRNPSATVVCTTCGTDLSRVQPQTSPQRQPSGKHTGFDFRRGEMDLTESSLQKEAKFYLAVLLIIILSLALMMMVIQNITNQGAAIIIDESTPDSPTALPTINAATVTLGPPTATRTNTPEPTMTPSETPTQGPCVITLPQGQSLIWAIANCGHQSLDVMPTVLALNNIADPGSVSSGQQILIPWPTETPNPDASATPTVETSGADNSDTSQTVLVVDESIEAFAPTEVPTLPPGIMWHEITTGENIITIADLYNADVKTLSELNREIDFARCDFGLRFGGQECLVQLFQGQLVRVPAPTPTPTLSPTPDPNATATPTSTPTYNQPSVFGPPNQAFFYADQLITLRWVPSATLNEGDSYQVEIRDTVTGQTYTALTRDISFTLPVEWRGTQQNRHEYMWTVGIINQQRPDEVAFQTEPHVFVWQGRTEGN